MTKQEWDEICSDTARKMLDHIKPYITPISRVMSDEEGELQGSGSYYECFGGKYLITNEHVANHMIPNSLSPEPLAHQFFDSDCVLRLTNDFLCLQFPIDVAVSHIEDKNWTSCSHNALGIPISRFAPKHEPFKGEQLFFAGYSAERSGFCFGQLTSYGTPYLTQETELPKQWEKPQFHFALHYAPDRVMERVDGNTLGLPIPKGFSGSLVWNTRLVECLQNGKEWTPDCAQVTGILCRWKSSSACVIATRVEHMRLLKLSELCNNMQSS